MKLLVKIDGKEHYFEMVACNTAKLPGGTVSIKELPIWVGLLSIGRKVEEVKVVGGKDNG